jgi:hypothetical protein
MTLFRRLATVAVTGALAAGAAAAPASADTTGFCPFVGSQLQPDGSTLLANEVGSAGCVIVRDANGTLTLDQVIVAPGYTDEIKSAGGVEDKNKIEVRFENPTTHDKAEFLFEPGKTEIK